LIDINGNIIPIVNITLPDKDYDGEDNWANSDEPYLLSNLWDTSGEQQNLDTSWRSYNAGTIEISTNIKPVAFRLHTSDDASTEFNFWKNYEIVF